MNELNMNCFIKVTIQSSTHIVHMKNFQLAKLLEVKKLTNGKANLDVLWCNFYDCKQVLLLEKIFTHPVKPVQFVK